MTLHWKAEYSIGIDTIDRQHKKIFEHLLAIENAVTKRDPWHIQQYLIRELERYLRFHFAVEEAMLEILRYPALAAHRQTHERLTTAVADIEDRLKHSGSTTHLVEFFEDWFIRHVLADDRDYARFADACLSRPPGA